MLYLLFRESTIPKPPTVAAGGGFFDPVTKTEFFPIPYIFFFLSIYIYTLYIFLLT